jgi:hypothetical protein
MVFPYGDPEAGYRAKIECKSGDSYSMTVRRTKWTGMYKDAEFEAVVNEKHFIVKASDSRPEVTGKRVAFFVSEGKFPYASLPYKGSRESNWGYSSPDGGRDQVSYELESAGRKYIVEFSDIKYDDYRIMIKGFSIHLTSHKV